MTDLEWFLLVFAILLIAAVAAFGWAAGLLLKAIYDKWKR